MNASIDIRRVFELFPPNTINPASVENALQMPFLFLGGLANESGCLAGNLSEAGLSVDDVDLAYRLVLQRGPESSEVVQEYMSTARSPFEMVSRLICSAEWAERVNELFRYAFPTIPRLWHLHAPKTGGSAFFDAGCRAGWGYINMNKLGVPNRDLRITADAVRFVVGNCLLVSGHKTAWQIQSGIGPFDSGILLLRHPLSRAVSYYNYALDVIAGRENVHNSPPEEFLNRGFDPKSFEQTWRAGFFEANEQCFYLSSDRVCRSALRVAHAYSIKLALVDDLSELCREYFGLSANRVNVSTNSLKISDLPSAIADAVIAENAADLALHSIALRRRLRGQGALAR